MSPPEARAQFARLAVGARVFGLLVLSVPILWFRDTTALLALLSVGVIWLAATAAERLPISATLALTVEAALIGAVCALSIGSSLAVLGSLAVPPFAAGLRRGPRGVALALSAQLVTLVTLSASLHSPPHIDEATGAFTWMVTGLGLGLIGSFVRSTAQLAPDPLTPYRDAQALIRQLIDLSGGLSSSLDPAALGDTIAETVRDELPVTAVVVHVPRDDELSPLVTDGGSAIREQLDALALTASRTLRLAASGRGFAFPLMTDVGLVAVVAGELPARFDPESRQLEGRLAKLAELLEPAAVHLDTALLFSALRDAATADERRRLAREMHDGIAQEIASLGYLVDGLASQPSSPGQAAQLRLLRERITRVVADVRRSVQVLRTEVGTSASLGAAIGSLARHLSASSGIPIQVTLDERTSRLRTEVEAELLRITQEALTNAVRHAHASTIDVHCRVAAPHAEIMVRDDGRGMGPRREDSQGLEIMHERARLIEADLRIEEAVPHGTVVTVRLPAAEADRSADTSARGDRVTA